MSERRFSNQPFFNQQSGCDQLAALKTLNSQGFQLHDGSWFVPSPTQAATIELVGNVVQFSLVPCSSPPVHLSPAAVRRKTNRCALIEWPSADVGAQIF